MINLSNEILFFEEKTKYPLSDFFNKYTEFISNDYIDLVGYYKGDSVENPVSLFNNLNSLIQEYSKLNDIVQINRDIFNTTAYWDLIDLIDNTGIEIKTLTKLSKWLRSSITNSRYLEDTETKYVLGQNENLEGLAKRMGYNDEQKVWLDLAQRNDIKEEDYNFEGGNILMLVVKSFSDNIYINSVVDNLTGEKVYGLDLSKKLSFNADEEDLNILDYKETILQAANILINLSKGSVPEFPSDGIQTDLIIGNNIGSVTYPTIFRQLYSTFAKDDTFKQLGIEAITQQVDGITIGLLIKTKLNEIFTENINLS